MQLEELLEYIDIPFSFHKRPIPLQPQLRVIWGLSTLVLILYICSRGKRSSISRLHILNWAIKTRENRERLTELLENRSSPVATFIQYEPGFNKGIEYAIAERLVELQNNGRVHLILNGEKLAKEIIATEQCLEDEKTFLSMRGASVTEQLAKNLLKFP
ncbi:hypothetical protein H6G54_29010 [Anabaena cylindrica FACHB-243]|uniref:Uncharacterized protein n=1 Tax=Anabaena cylindrica (strain ATCC 27899 / PCC 7122) TaxID=272123 RepID=K9ZS27_ANACC|nr:MULTISPECIES: hypothetical protein [Anabaena]AFZ61170.1 hypothetical protein Anacy_5879 [Anabaena cylindrica PCC 7122]MBD2421646.1 hypothetical protein [Anabaena cylindrica FACHB-243]MBY5280455.1 hypothetical protein [Anabaena sp. CCAP 1446/1C]MBY5308186.1 hypothetical protein [Anabaena sp. CCAP 1446/1C]MCM2405452.1 hypothetical protein [Anabaena sp. CCAP 1446/1C]